ncbi:MAG: prepilin-type N-terminal cleavage/methylation domain-containing protein [Acinetobacter sp.]|uniref:type IV pilin protein n=1 Tax=Acinetobacter sp. TaxID=472 RepID=UPI000F9ED3A2|nr:type IV pilin protein [Acinetobacter sp.]RUP36743.1 MAG: prepilin-type N-terminal cleavage/methylation domain-containing protein [Acinetobacter sp.]
MGEIINRLQKIEGAAQVKSRFSKGKLATGFTLIELMMVLAMIAIFMALAIPSYQEYVRRADASMAQQEMQKIAEQLTRHKAKNFTYRGFDPAYLYSASSPMTSVVLPQGATGTAIKYTITIRAADDTTKLLTAVDGNTPPKATILGRDWVMRAEASDIRNYNFLMTSTGIRCKNKTKANVTYEECGTISTGKEDW